jgi:hypothetical protein
MSMLSAGQIAVRDRGRNIAVRLSHLVDPDALSAPEADQNLSGEATPAATRQPEVVSKGKKPGGALLRRRYAASASSTKLAVRSRALFGAVLPHN